MQIDRQRQDNRRLIDELRDALDRNYDRLRATAKQQWEHNFAGKDPSDACVSVRITAGDPPRHSIPCAGILRKKRRLLLDGHRHGLTA